MRGRRALRRDGEAPLACPRRSEPAELAPGSSDPRVAAQRTCRLGIPCRPRRSWRKHHHARRRPTGASTRDGAENTSGAVASGGDASHDEGTRDDGAFEGDIEVSISPRGRSQPCNGFSGVSARCGFRKARRLRRITGAIARSVSRRREKRFRLHGREVRPCQASCFRPPVP